LAPGSVGQAAAGVEEDGGGAGRGWAAAGEAEDLAEAGEDLEDSAGAPLAEEAQAEVGEKKSE